MDYLKNYKKLKELNNAMKAMRVSIKDQDQVRQSSDYANADSTQQHTLMIMLLIISTILLLKLMRLWILKVLIKLLKH